jgi:hypothetical protein
MRVLHDLICENEHVVRNVVVQVVVAEGLATPYGVCKKCHAPYRICWLHGKAPSTDVLGHEVSSEVLGVTYTSTRERDRKMRAKGFEPADRIRGGPMSQSHHLPEKLTPRGYEGRAQFHGDEVSS